MVHCGNGLICDNDARHLRSFRDGSFLPHLLRDGVFGSSCALYDKQLGTEEFFSNVNHSGLVRENSCDKATCNFINVKAQNATDNDTYSTYTVACIILAVKIFTLLSTDTIIL